jgi:hypothetical protein
VIEDGGHTMRQQITSFEVLFPFLNPGGIYFLEDLLTSWMCMTLSLLYLQLHADLF